MEKQQKQMLLALERELEINLKKFNTAKTIGNSTGFFQYYFKILENHETQVAAFNEVNDLYFETFGEVKYSSWDS